MDRANKVANDSSLASFILESSVLAASEADLHRTNFFIHGLNAALLLALLLRTTKSLPASLIAAALFAVHPLRVESVAWLTERKDVLGMFFGLLCIHAYTSYCRSLSWRWYAASLAALLLSLG